MTKLNKVYDGKMADKRKIESYVLDNVQDELKKEKKRKIMFRGSIILTVIAFFAFFVGIEDKSVTYITIDINPSIEMIANEDDIVIEVNPLNEDAVILLTDLEVVGLSIEEASVLIAEEARVMGFIDETSDDNLVLVTIYEDDEERQKELEEQISEGLEEHFKEKLVDVAIKSQGITPALKDQANEYGVSNGKMMYIKKAVESSDEYTVEELVDLTMKEINAKLKESLREKNELKAEEREQIKEQKKAEQVLKVEEHKSDQNKPVDAGKDSEDKGNKPEEAGEKPVDKGNESEDAGKKPVDKGNESKDAGEKPDDKGNKPENAGKQSEDKGKSSSNGNKN